MFDLNDAYDADSKNINDSDVDYLDHRPEAPSARLPEPDTFQVPYRDMGEGTPAYIDDPTMTIQAVSRMPDGPVKDAMYGICRMNNMIAQQAQFMRERSANIKASK